MAITSTNPDGIRVDSAGMNETVGAQAELTAAHSYNVDGPPYVDQTTAANSATTGDISLWPTGGSVDINDAYYFGHTLRWECLRMTMTATASYSETFAAIWEYYNGTSWVSLTVVSDGFNTTNPFDTAGTNELRFTIPTDWASTTVNSIAAYYIRIRCTDADAAITTAPTGAEAWLSPLTQVVFSDTILNAGNTQLDASAVYPGRLVILRQGGSDEETRYIVSEAAGDGTKMVATISEEWVKPPSVTDADTVHVNYNLQDAVQLTGLTFSNKTKLFTFSRRLGIGSTGGGGAFAFFALVDGDAYESVDQSSTTVGDTTIEDNGLFQSGYLLQGAPVSGGYVFGTPALDGELVFDMKTGGLCNFYDFQHRSVFEHTWEQDGGTINWNKTKVFQATRMLLGGTMSILDSTIEGTNNTTDTVRIEDTMTIDGLNLVNTYGFTSLDDTLTEVMTVKNVKFISQNIHIEVHDDKTWHVINPTWTIIPSTQDQLSFPVDDLNSVIEEYSLDITTQDPAGTSIANAQVFLYEGLTNNTLVIGGDTVEKETDASGVYSDVWVYKTYSYATATTLSVAEEGEHVLKLYKYGKIPFVGAITSNAKFDSPITMLNDSSISEASQATALTDGAGIVVTNPTNATTLLTYTIASNTVSLGETVTGATTGSGTVEEIVVGDGTGATGTLFINARDGDPYVGALSNGGTWDATIGAETRYAWEVDCNSLSLQKAHDYLAAEMASNPIDPAIFETVVEWGEGEESQLLYLGSNGFFTNRNVNKTEGVFLSHFGAGAIEFMTDDVGGTFAPPSTVNLTMNDMQANSKYRIEKVSDGSLIADGNSGGTEGNLIQVIEGFTHTTDIDVLVLVRKSSSPDNLRFLPYEIPATITNQGFTVTVTQAIDTIAD